MNETAAVQVLKDARKLIAEIGWCRGHAQKENAKLEVIGYCSIGAVTTAAWGHKHAAVIAGHALALLKMHLPEKYTYVTRWNDAMPNRIPVLKYFDYVIGLHEAE